MSAMTDLWEMDAITKTSLGMSSNHDRGIAYSARLICETRDV